MGVFYARMSFRAVLILLCLFLGYDPPKSTAQEMPSSEDLGPVFKYLDIRNPLVITGAQTSTKDLLRSWSLRDDPNTVRLPADVFDLTSDARGLELGPSLVVHADSVGVERLRQLHDTSGSLSFARDFPCLFVFSPNSSLGQALSSDFDFFKLPIDRRAFFLERDSGSLFERYSINGINVQTDLGTWINGTLQVEVDEGFLKRRSDFHEVELKALTEDQEPYIMFRDYPYPTGPGPDDDPTSETYRIDHLDVTYGMFYEVLKILKKELNFTTTLSRRYDGNWGTPNKTTGLFSDSMVAMIENEQADIAACSLTLNPERFNAIDYLFPIGTETYAIYISNPDQEAVDWNIYREPFRTDVWIFLSVSVVVLAVFVHIINVAYDKFKDGGVSGDKKEDEWMRQYQDMANEFEWFRKNKGMNKVLGYAMSLLAHMWMVFSSYFGGKPDHPPGDDRWGARFMVFSVLLTGNMVFMSYRAAITSELAVWSIRMPFSSLNELLGTSYQLKVLAGGLMQAYFVESPPGSILHQLYVKSMMAYGEPFFDNLDDGLKSLVNSDYQALFNTLEGVRSKADYRCRVVPAWTTNYPALLAMAVPKQSPLAPFMFHAFLELLENGSLTALKARWKGVEPICAPDRITSLGFEKIIMVFLLVTCGMGLAVLIFTTELFLGHCSRYVTRFVSSRRHHSDVGLRKVSMAQISTRKQKTEELLEHVRRILKLGPEMKSTKFSINPSAEDLIFQLELLLKHLREEKDGMRFREMKKNKKSDFGMGEKVLDYGLGEKAKFGAFTE